MTFSWMVMDWMRRSGGEPAGSEPWMTKPCQPCGQTLPVELKRTDLDLPSRGCFRFRQDALTNLFPQPGTLRHEDTRDNGQSDQPE